MTAAAHRLRSPVLALLLSLLSLALAGGCTKSPTPFDVALDYGRAVYATDTAAIYRLVSSDDRRVKDEATFRQQRPEPTAFTREVMRQLASYVTAAPVKTTVSGTRATVTLKFRLPDANAPEIAALMRDWDD